MLRIVLMRQSNYNEIRNITNTKKKQANTALLFKASFYSRIFTEILERNKQPKCNSHYLPLIL